MGTYKNDYAKKEDTMMWELHEIRYRIAESGHTIEDINQAAKDIAKKYRLDI